MSFVRRVEIPCNEPMYVFASPCCKVIEIRPAWVIERARNQDGIMLIQCGRTATDPLRPVTPNGRKGCATWFQEDVSHLP